MAERPRHVLWLGGPPDTGKTTVARLLAQRHGWHLHVLDENQVRSVGEIDADLEPTLAKFLAMSNDERWAVGPAGRMADWVLDIAREGLPRLVRDLESWYRGEPVLVEGPWLFADDVAPLLLSRSQALWLMPSPDFKRASALRRDKPNVRHLTASPELVTSLWFERDLLIGAHIRRGCREHGLTMLPVDGSRSANEIASDVESHFFHHLGQAGSPGSASAS